MVTPVQIFHLNQLDVHYHLYKLQSCFVFPSTNENNTDNLYRGPTAPVSMTNALNFLDAVRIQKPTVYNEFLALMKNWKTQQ